MKSFLVGWLPLLVAIALVLCLYSAHAHLTRGRSALRRRVTWPLPLLVLVPVWLGGAALVLSLVGGDLVREHHFQGSRGSMFWQERAIVMLHAAHLERHWFEIKSDSHNAVAKVDYAKWLVVQTDTVELLGAGRDVVWLAGNKLGLHERDLYTGAWLRGQRELVGNVTLAERPYHYDAAAHALEVTTKDGRTLRLE